MLQPDAREMLVLWEEEEKDDSDTALHVAEILENLRLAENVERALGSTGHLTLRGIEISVGNRVVFLQGKVPSYYLKQIATITALGVLGVESVRNDLEVVVGLAGRR
jgi:osmotically-inducible protein OsmY